MAWKSEVEKKPPAMSVDDAYEVLGLARATAHPESAVRKAYYRLAQQYHPDKNPAGRVKLTFSLITGNIFLSSFVVICLKLFVNL